MSPGDAQPAASISASSAHAAESIRIDSISASGRRIGRGRASRARRGGRRPMWMKTNAARVLFRASHGDITKIGGFARFSRGGKRCGGRGHAGMPVCPRACPHAAHDARSCVSPLPDASVARPASRDERQAISDKRQAVGGKRQAAGGRRQAAGGRRQAAGKRFSPCRSISLNPSRASGRRPRRGGSRRRDAAAKRRLSERAQRTMAGARRAELVRAAAPPLPARF